MPSPSPNGQSVTDHRTGNGRFARGNPGGPGNPHARRTGMLRSAMLEAVTEDDVRAVVRGLVDRAKAGDAVAVRELLDRVTGKARPEEEQAAPQWLAVDLPEAALRAVADTIRARRAGARC